MIMLSYDAHRNPPLWMEWALMEWSTGDAASARRLFAQGASVPQLYQHPPLYEAWSRMEAEAGNGRRAEELAMMAKALEAAKQAQRGVSRASQ